MGVTVPLKPLRPRGQVSASSFNTVQRLVQQLMRMSGIGSFFRYSAGGVHLQLPGQPIFAELLTSPFVTPCYEHSGSGIGSGFGSGVGSGQGRCLRCGYGWRQVVLDCNDWVQIGDGASSEATQLPAYEINNRRVPLLTTVPIPQTGSSGSGSGIPSGSGQSGSGSGEPTEFETHPTRVILFPDPTGRAYVFNWGGSGSDVDGEFLDVAVLDNACIQDIAIGSGSGSGAE